MIESVGWHFASYQCSHQPGAHIEVALCKGCSPKSRARKVIEDLNQTIANAYDGQSDLNHCNLVQTEQALSNIANDKQTLASVQLLMSLIPRSQLLTSAHNVLVM